MQNSIYSYLAEAGQSAPSAGNMQPWFFHEKNNQLFLYIDLEKLEDSYFSREHPVTLLAVGAVVENIMQTAQLNDMDLEFDYFPPQDSGKCASFKVKNKNLKRAEKTEQLALFNRCTNRLPFNKKTVPQNILDELLSLSTANAQLVAYQSKEEISLWSKWLYTASEVRFRTPNIHEWFEKTLKFTPEEVATREGLDIKLLELPAISALILKVAQTWKQMSLCNKFYIYKLLAKLETLNINAAPALIGIIASPGMPFAIESGRLMEKMWIKANELGLSIQPYYAVSDQMYRLKKGIIPSSLEASIAHLDDEINTTLKLKNAFVYILFRVGYCDKTPQKSLRHLATMKG